MEKEQGGIEERVWREEWEGRNDWIMISTKGKKFIKKMQKKKSDMTCICFLVRPVVCPM